jgi:hypothetical protein
MAGACQFLRNAREVEGGKKVKKSAAAALSAFLLCAGPAHADVQMWNVTEVGPDGAQGQWMVTVDGSANINARTNMQFDTGAPLSYTVEGSVKDDVFHATFNDRSDGKKNCVATGKVYLNDNKSHKVIGEVQCEDEKFFFRAGY